MNEKIETREQGLEFGSEYEHTQEICKILEKPGASWAELEIVAKQP